MEETKEKYEKKDILTVSSFLGSGGLCSWGILGLFMTNYCLWRPKSDENKAAFCFPHNLVSILAEIIWS